MLSEAYKKEALEILKNITSDELKRILKTIGSKEEGAMVCDKFDTELLKDGTFNVYLNDTVKEMVEKYDLVVWEDDLEWNIFVDGTVMVSIEPLDIHESVCPAENEPFNFTKQFDSICKRIKKTIDRNCWEEQFKRDIRKGMKPTYHRIAWEDPRFEDHKAYSPESLECRIDAIIGNYFSEEDIITEEDKTEVRKKLDDILRYAEKKFGES